MRSALAPQRSAPLSQSVNRRPRPAALALPLALLVAMLLGGCDLQASLRCAFTDIRADLRSPDASTRGLAAECALNQSPEQIVPLVPVLLPQLGDATVYRSVQTGGGLIGFGEAGVRSLAVGGVALRAVQKAQPVEANVEPVVQTLVAAAKAMRSTAYVGVHGDPGTTAVAMMQLLMLEFHRAGLGAAVAAALTREMPVLRGTTFAQDPANLRVLQSLANGVAPDLYGGVPRPEAQPPQAPQPPPLPGKHGLTWAAAAPKTPGGFSASCHAEPKAPMDALHNGSCNPYSGDTACTTTLPLLCFSAKAGRLAATAPVAGTELVSRAAADARCEQAWGRTWRMAEHHDGGSGWEIHAQGAPPQLPTRFWVAINNQPGNCWP